MKKQLVSKVTYALMIVMLALAALPVTRARAAGPYFTRANGNWNAVATWSTAGCGGAAAAAFPVAGEDVTICSGNTVTLTAAAAAGSITFNAHAANSGITLAGFTLTVSGAVSMNAATGSSTGTLSVGTGTLNAGSLTISGSNSNNFNNAVTVSTGTITVTGNVTFNSGNRADTAVLSTTGAATVNIGGDLTGAVNNGTLDLINTANWYLGGNYTFAGTLSNNNRMQLTLNGTGDQTINGTNTFRSLIVNKASGTATAGKAITINNVGMTVTAGTLDLSTFAHTLVGVLTVSNGATLRVGGTEDLTGFGSYTLGATSNVEYYGAAQSVNATTYGNLTLSGSGLKTISSSFTATTLSIAPTGTAKASLGPGVNVSVTNLYLGTFGSEAGTFGSSVSAATFMNDLYFDSTAGRTGIVTSATTLPVTMNYFHAKYQSGSLSIDWSTGTETGNVGFNLYVWDAYGKHKLNTQLIPSTGFTTHEPQDYHFAVSGLALSGTVSFTLEDVDFLGRTVLHGPFVADKVYGQRVTGALTDWQQILAECSQHQVLGKRCAGYK
jgi:fibronectin-binding autotransporter adhesin